MPTDSTIADVQRVKTWTSKDFKCCGMSCVGSIKSRHRTPKLPNHFFPPRTMISNKLTNLLMMESANGVAVTVDCLASPAKRCA